MQVKLLGLDRCPAMLDTPFERQEVHVITEICSNWENVDREAH